MLRHRLRLSRLACSVIAFAVIAQPQLACRSVATSGAGKHGNAATVESCGNPRAYAGGMSLPLDGGGRLWFRVAGKSDGAAVVVVHGGPGSNDYNFERSIGPLAERELRMVYVDQRGCGRSTTPDGHPRLGMDPTIDDLERLRKRVGAERWVLLGHSFGGLVALEYQRRFPAHVAGLVLAETTADLPDALRHQIATLARIAPARFLKQAAELARIAADRGSAFKRLMRCYDLLGRVPLQRAIAFASDEGQQTLERWDAENAFTCGAGVAQAYADQGWIDRVRPETQRKLDCPAIVFAGRKSEVIGADNVIASAKLWGAQIVWFERSGHFPDIEEPEEFVRALVAFTRQLRPFGSGSRSAPSSPRNAAGLRRSN